MPLEFFEVSEVIPATPEEIYAAWLDSEKHAAMTRSSASIEGFVNGSFTAGDGYIRGRTIELEPNRRIVQSWRSNEFPEGAADSRIDIRLEPADSGTRVSIAHSDIPEGQSQRYRDSWREFYFQPMKQYFGRGETFDRELTPIGDVMPPAMPSEAPKKRGRPPKAAGEAKAKSVSKPAKAKRARKPAKKARAARGPKRRGRKSTGKRTAARRSSAARRSKGKSAGRKGAKKRGARRSKR